MAEMKRREPQKVQEVGGCAVFADLPSVRLYDSSPTGFFSFAGLRSIAAFS